jgi:RNase P subunit RPR2
MAADTDKKKVAREMMEMAKTINAKYPATMKKVTCWTCHRGKAEPDKAPGTK